MPSPQLVDIINHIKRKLQAKQAEAKIDFKLGQPGKGAEQQDRAPHLKLRRLGEMRSSVLCSGTACPEQRRTRAERRTTWSFVRIGLHVCPIALCFPPPRVRVGAVNVWEFVMI